jgi:hypothetical protein
MWTNPQYLRSWRDLRRRELLFWLFVLSYVPGMLLIIAAVDVIGRDLPAHIGAYFSAVRVAIVFSSADFDNWRQAPTTA